MQNRPYVAGQRSPEFPDHVRAPPWITRRAAGAAGRRIRLLRAEGAGLLCSPMSCPPPLPAPTSRPSSPTPMADSPRGARSAAFHRSGITGSANAAEERGSLQPQEPAVVGLRGHRRVAVRPCPGSPISPIIRGVTPVTTAVVGGWGQGSRRRWCPAPCPPRSRCARGPTATPSSVSWAKEECALHPLHNDGHQVRAGQMLREMQRDLCVRISSEVAWEIREDQRTSTTVITRSVQPLVEAHVNELARRFREFGHARPFPHRALVGRPHHPRHGNAVSESPERCSRRTARCTAGPTP